MKNTKIINGLLCTVLLLQSLTGVGVTVFADETNVSINSEEIISKSLSESVGLTEDNLSDLPNESKIRSEESLSESSDIPLISETVIEHEAVTESSSEAIPDSSVNSKTGVEVIEQQNSSPENIIANGTYGTVPWYITREGTLVLESGTLPDVEGYTIYQSPWYSYNANIYKVVIDDAVIATAYGADHLFGGLARLKSIIGLENIDFSGAVSLRSLFSQTSLQTLDVSSMDVTQVNDASNMFYGIVLSELNLSNWDVQNMYNISSMFAYSEINRLDLSNWDTYSISSLSSLFYYSKIDEVIGIENWKVPNLYDANVAFENSQFKHLDLSNWQPNSIRYMGGMFRNSSVESIDLSGWNTNNLFSRYGENNDIFSGTTNLQKLTLDSNTIFQKESYNHQSENYREDIWEGVNSKEIYGNTVSLLIDYQRISETFVRKQQTYHNVTFKDYYSIGNDQMTEVKHGDTVWVPENPTIEGYEFNGWYIDSEFTKLYNFSKPIEENVTIYVKWIPKGNKISFDSDGGTFIEDQTVLTGETIEIPKEPRKEGLHFLGWYLNEWDFTPFNFLTPVTGELELKARWGYTLSFETDSKTQIPNQYFDNRLQYPIQPENPWKKGYEFLGWYLDKELTQSFLFYSGIELQQSTTLYAKYNKIGEQLDLFGSLRSEYENNYELYDDETFSNNISEKIDITEATFNIKESFTSNTGQVYYSIFGNREWIGYIPEYYVAIASGKEGIANSFNQYVILNDSYPIISSFNEMDKEITADHKKRTFLAKEEFHHFNGESYVSLYNKSGTLIGYINKSAVELTEGPQGTAHSFEKYTTIVDDSVVIWYDLTFLFGFYTSEYINQTLLVKDIYYHFDGKNYVSIIDNQGNLLGYTREDYINISNGQEGTYQNYGKYVSIKGNYDIWNGFEWQNKLSGAKFKNQTFHAKGVYYHFNGSSYLSVYDNKGEWIGYINENGTNVGSGEQGSYQNYGKYVSIIGNYDIWDGFEWQNKLSGSGYENQTFKARGYYNHFNGSRYLSLYDNKGRWIGYINENGTSLANGEQGLYQNYGKYVSIIGNYDIWDGFEWRNKIEGSKYSNQTFHAKGIYHHFNGSRYLSLYDNKGQWIGYINENGTSLANGEQGPYQNYGKYVSVIGNYDIWDGFEWRNKIQGSKYSNQTFQAKGVYNHFNGSRYLSLYDNKGKWIGYMNEKGTQVAKNQGGIAQSAKFNRKIVKKNYTIWNDLNFKKKKGNSNQYLNQSLYVKVQYSHFNGSKYYSLYNSQNKWLGYINANGTK